MIRAFCLSGFLAIAAARATAPASPVDELKLNTFAERYNHYVEELRAGVIDLKQWERVKKAWEGLQ